jgi:hypothetical protein
MKLTIVAMAIASAIVLSACEDKDEKRMAEITKYCIANMPQKFLDKYGFAAVSQDCQRTAKEEVTGVKSAAPWNLYPDSYCAIEKPEYAKISLGMDYNSVAKIIGCNGDATGTNKIGTITTSSYQWKGKGGYGTALFIFQNDKLVQMNQGGL